MVITAVEVWDAIGANEHLIPADITAAGYDTGPGVAWSASQFASRTLPYPAVHYDQDPNASDTTADLLDVEARAATLAEIVGWLGAARKNYIAGTRPGQRWPGLYMSMGNLGAAIQDLQSAGLTNVPFVTAQPGNSQAFAIQRVVSAIGPYPCVGCQYEFDTSVDKNMFSVPWLTTVSVTPSVTPITNAVDGAFVKVGGQPPVYWYDGTQLWHIPDPAVLKFMRQAGFTCPIVNITAAQLAALGPVIS